MKCAATLLRNGLESLHWIVCFIFVSKNSHSHIGNRIKISIRRAVRGDHSEVGTTSEFGAEERGDLSYSPISECSSELGMNLAKSVELEWRRDTKSMRLRSRKSLVIYRDALNFD